MLVLSPKDYNLPSVRQFYRDTLRAMGIRCNDVSIQGYSRVADFTVVGPATGVTLTELCDIGNPAPTSADNIPFANIGTYPGRAVYQGVLQLTQFGFNLTGANGISFLNMYYALGPNDALGYQIFKMRQNIINAAGTEINNVNAPYNPTNPNGPLGYIDVIQNMFSFLRMDVNVAAANTGSFRCEYAFDGIKISY